MCQVRGHDGYYIVHGGSGNRKEDSQASWFVGFEGKAALRGVGSTSRRPPKANAPPPNVHIDYSDSQVPPCDEYLYSDPDYPIEVYAS